MVTSGLISRESRHPQNATPGNPNEVLCRRCSRVSVSDLLKGRIVEVLAPDYDTGVDSASQSGLQKRTKATESERCSLQTLFKGFGALYVWVPSESARLDVLICAWVPREGVKPQANRASFTPLYAVVSELSCERQESSWKLECLRHLCDV